MMNPMTRVAFQEWATKYDWVKFGEQPLQVKTADGIMEGEQEAYVLPNGRVVFPIFVKGSLHAVAMPMPPSPQPAPQRMPSGIDIPGLFPPNIGRG